MDTQRDEYIDRQVDDIRLLGEQRFAAYMYRYFDLDA